MPTLRGIVFLIIHAALLAVGLVRNELGVVVYGGGVVLVCLITAAFSLVHGVRVRAGRSAFSAELECAVADAGAPVRVVVRVPPLRLAPGFVLEHRVRLSWDARRELAGSATVQPGARAVWSLEPRERGAYHAPGSSLELIDLLGFTRVRVFEAHPLRLLVVPPAPDLVPPLPARRGGEHAARPTDARVRSDELREVRPYTAGDDTRRLSWKHFAAHQELLIRVGEFIPPSQGEVSCRVDGYLPPGEPAERVGDELMAALRAVLREASDRRMLVRCRVPGVERVLVVDPAALPWIASGWRGALPDDAARSDRAASVSDADRLVQLLAGFVPPGDRPQAPAAAPARTLVITARPSAGAGALSVAHELARRPPTRRRLADLVLREVP